MAAQTALCVALGHSTFGLSEAKAFLAVAGVGWDDDPSVAGKIVELWLSDPPWARGSPNDWTMDLLQQAHTAVHGTGAPNACSFAKSSLYRLLKTSHDPSADASQSTEDDVDHAISGIGLAPLSRPRQP